MAIFPQQNSAKKESLSFVNEPAATPAPVREPSLAADFNPSQVAPPRTNVQPEAKESLIAADLTIEGKIEGSGHVRIAGRFKGDVNVQGDLTIERGAKLNGGVRANKVTVAGELEGNIESASRVDLVDSAALTGDIKAGSLTIAAGSRVRGNIECGWGDKDGSKANGKSDKSGRELDS